MLLATREETGGGSGATEAETDGVLSGRGVTVVVLWLVTVTEIVPPHPFLVVVIPPYPPPPYPPPGMETAVVVPPYPPLYPPWAVEASDTDVVFL